MGALDDRICVVTGSNTGIGLETARGLARQGATVILAVRDLARGEAARADLAASTGSERLEVMKLDLANLASIRAFADELKRRHDRLHVLVNNAGIWATKRETTADGFESMFGVNHLGTFLLTLELLDLLKASAPARIVTLASAAHLAGRIDFGNLQSERSFSAMGAYGTSKLGNLLFTYELARRLEGTSVTANAVHPGVVGTDLFRSYPAWLAAIARVFTATPGKGARTSVYLASSPEVQGVSGKYFAGCRQKKSSKASRDGELQRRLWEASEKLVGLAS